MLSIAAPSPAYALRPANVSQSTGLEELKDALQPSQSSAGLEEVRLEPLTPETIRESGERLRELIEQVPMNPLIRQAVAERGGPPDISIWDPRLSFVARDRSGEIVGVAAAYPREEEGDAYLAWLVMTPEARGQGMGRRLFDAVLAAAAGLGKEKLQWEVLVRNVEARRFYDRLNARVVGRTPSPLGLADALVFELPTAAGASAGLEEQQEDARVLDALAAAVVSQARGLREFPSYPGPDQETQINRLRRDVYLGQLELLGRARLLRRVLYIANGLDFYPAIHAEKMLAVDFKVDQPSMESSANVVEERFGAVVPDLPIVLKRIRQIKARMESDTGRREIREFLQEAHAAGPATIFLKGYEWVGTNRDEKFWRVVEPHLQSGDAVILFSGASSTLERALRQRGYTDGLPASTTKVLSGLSDELASRRRTPYVFISGFEFRLAEPFRVLIKPAAAGLEEGGGISPDGIPKVLDEIRRWQFLDRGTFSPADRGRVAGLAAALSEAMADLAGGSGDIMTLSAPEQAETLRRALELAAEAETFSRELTGRALPVLWRKDQAPAWTVLKAGASARVMEEMKKQRPQQVVARLGRDWWEKGSVNTVTAGEAPDPSFETGLLLAIEPYIGAVALIDGREITTTIKLVSVKPGQPVLETSWTQIVRESPEKEWVQQMADAAASDPRPAHLAKARLSAGLEEGEDEGGEVSPEARASFLKGWQALSGGDVEGAIAVFKRVTGMQEDYTAAWVGLGQAYLRRNKPGDERVAAAAYEQAVHLDPEDSENIATLAEIYGLLGDFGKAIPLARRAIGLYEEGPHGWTVLGRLFHALARVPRESLPEEPAPQGESHWLGEAEKAFREALRLDIEDAEVRVELAGVLEDQGRDDLAEEEYRRALRKEDKNADIRYALGLLLARRWDPSGAAGQMRAALELLSKKNEFNSVWWERCVEQLILAEIYNPRLDEATWRRVGPMMGNVRRLREAWSAVYQAASIEVPVSWAIGLAEWDRGSGVTRDMLREIVYGDRRGIKEEEGFLRLQVLGGVLAAIARTQRITGTPEPLTDTVLLDLEQIYPGALPWGDHVWERMTPEGMISRVFSALKALPAGLEEGENFTVNVLRVDRTQSFDAVVLDSSEVGTHWLAEAIGLRTGKREEDRVLIIAVRRNETTPVSADAPRPHQGPPFFAVTDGETWVLLNGVGVDAARELGAYLRELPEQGEELPNMLSDDMYGVHVRIFSPPQRLTNPILHVAIAPLGEADGSAGPARSGLEEKIDIPTVFPALGVGERLALEDVWRQVARVGNGDWEAIRAMPFEEFAGKMGAVSVDWPAGPEVIPIMYVSERGYRSIQEKRGDIALARQAETEYLSPERARGLNPQWWEAPGITGEGVYWFPEEMERYRASLGRAVSKNAVFHEFMERFLMRHGIEDENFRVLGHTTPAVIIGDLMFAARMGEEAFKRAVADHRAVLQQAAPNLANDPRFAGARLREEGLLGVDRRVYEKWGEALWDRVSRRQRVEDFVRQARGGFLGAEGRLPLSAGVSRHLSGNAASSGGVIVRLPPVFSGAAGSSVFAQEQIIAQISPGVRDSVPLIGLPGERVAGDSGARAVAILLREGQARGGPDGRDLVLLERHADFPADAGIWEKALAAEGIAAGNRPRIVAVDAWEADGLTAQVLGWLRTDPSLADFMELTLAEMVRDEQGNWYAVATWA